MNELRLGHSVIAWGESREKSVKGKYIARMAISGTHLLINSKGLIEEWEKAELDPSAEEFLNGDVVEISENGETWREAVYVGISEHEVPYVHMCVFDQTLLGFKYCRYPQPKKKFTFTSDMTREDIIKKTDEMYKSWGIK